jgi:hypothetical protein
MNDRAKKIYYNKKKRLLKQQKITLFLQCMDILFPVGMLVVFIAFTTGSSRGLKTRLPLYFNDSLLRFTNFFIV